MRKRLIDECVRGFAQRYAQALQEQCPNVVKDLEQLRDSVKENNTWKDDKVPEDYINAIIGDYPALLTQEPDAWELEKYNDILKRDPEMLTRDVVYGFTSDTKDEQGQVVEPGKTLRGKLYERILFCLRYKNARSILGPLHQAMGLKTCFYCNIQYTDSSEEGEVFYEMDHLKPQSLYPFLGTCFYNLQPSDSACNKRKLTKPCDSQLYINDPTEDRSPFHFVPQVVELDKTRGTFKCMKIDFVDSQGDYAGACKEYNETFRIIQRYSSHYRDVEDVYWKNSQCGVTGQKEHYKSSLNYKPTADEIYNYCLGFPYNEETINEAPLRKLKIDTVKQLEKNGVLNV
jgi:hypothetical protein